MARAPTIVAAMAAALLGGSGHAGEATRLAYDDWFTDEAMRVDLSHSGTRGKDVFGVIRVAAEPVWPGTRVHLIDPTGYGKYRFRLFDQASGREIYSKGYCTLFGEWTTTEEARSGMWRSMTEPLRFPFPRAPVSLAIEARDDKRGQFVEIQRFPIDATAYDIRRDRRFDFSVSVLNGCERPPENAVDIVVVPDGYTRDEGQKMRADARRFTEVLLRHAPFDRHRHEIAVRLVEAFSRESGPDEPRKALFHDTIVETTFDTFRSDRYLTVQDAVALRDVAALAPYDVIVVMVNSNRYGGGGIFDSFAVFTSDSEYDEYVLVHEFGHAFAGLGDEYYESGTYEDDAFYADGVEPWEPNLTVETDPARIKWRAFIAPGTPIPTPDDPRYEGIVGLYEGAGYRARGLFRPTRDSNMFHKGLLPFGPVNEAAIERMIAYHTGKEIAP